MYTGYRTGFARRRAPCCSLGGTTFQDFQAVETFQQYLLRGQFPSSTAPRAWGHTKGKSE